MALKFMSVWLNYSLSFTSQFSGLHALSFSPTNADYFRYIDLLQVGDEVTVTNLWEKLTYTVADIQIIQPHEVDKIRIQPNRDLLTLLTCHPYASGGRQRYVVVCERTT